MEKTTKSLPQNQKIKKRKTSIKKHQKNKEKGKQKESSKGVPPETAQIFFLKKCYKKSCSNSGQKKDFEHPSKEK